MNPQHAARFTSGLAVGLAAACFAAAALSQPHFEPVASGFAHPWAVAFLPEGRFLVTERPGRMRVIGADGKVGPPLAGVPEVAARGQGGLLDVVPDSGFASNREIYFCFSEPGEGGTNSTALARAQLARDETRLENVKVIFSQKPKVASTLHFGCRIVEARDGTLLLTMGERNVRRNDAQNLGNHLGKIVRLHKDGSVPRDNPFVGRSGAQPEIFSWGHRNSQGATLAADGTFWEIEHGPQGGDEINLPEPGRNYGWPVITYGEEYGGGRIGEGTAKAGMEQPLHYWVPSIAPSGMAFLTSERYGAAWKGQLFVGSLKFGYLDRIELAGRKVVGEHRLEVGERVRDVRQGPDGLLYIVTDEASGKLMRLVP
ncbi:MAG TPA: PQQ-dependent sugar dehydrogenase [Ramlibacter sp.]|uniref:PQQ-dependent sugar dehydrogenase n=1 Tax=Ramlibacter sp. TaxID=1917967 RepID=UPI002B8912BA|nr:PQQ-dependent sugar dehydrogenase [Ramlibacter sp.]HVZ43024.1 PQQ-dependent sugar dehydrogenase [Ramlibacter sp.]